MSHKYRNSKKENNTNTSGQLNSFFEQSLSKAQEKVSKNFPGNIDYIYFREISDEKLREHTHGMFRNDQGGKRTLYVYADSPIWAKEFSLNSLLYMARVKMKFGDTWIDEIKFLVSNRAYRKKQERKKDEKPPYYIDQSTRLSLSDEEKSKIDKKISVIKNEDLRKRLKKALISNLEWQKGKNV